MTQARSSRQFLSRPLRYSDAGIPCEALADGGLGSAGSANAPMSYWRDCSRDSLPAAVHVALCQSTRQSAARAWSFAGCDNRRRLIALSNKDICCAIQFPGDAALVLLRADEYRRLVEVNVIGEAERLGTSLAGIRAPTAVPCASFAHSDVQSAGACWREGLPGAADSDRGLASLSPSLPLPWGCRMHAVDAGFLERTRKHGCCDCCVF